MSQLRDHITAERRRVRADTRTRVGHAIHAVEHLARRVRDHWSEAHLESLAAIGTAPALAAVADLVRGHDGKHKLADGGFWVPPIGPAQQRFSSHRLAVERRPVTDLAKLLGADHPVGLPLDRVVREPAATPVEWHFMSLRGTALPGTGPDRFAATVAEADRRLASRIAELTARRERLGRLGSGDRALLPDRACALLDRLREEDFADDVVDAFREGLVLALALLPAGFDDYLGRVENAFADPEYVDLINAAGPSPAGIAPIRASTNSPRRWPGICWITLRCSRCRWISTPGTGRPGTGWSTATGRSRRRPGRD